jgi:hypothetical protein
MEISGVSFETAQSLTATHRAHETAAAKLHNKALEIQEQTANQLIQSVPDPDSNVGQNVDVTV